MVPSGHLPMDHNHESCQYSVDNLADNLGIDSNPLSAYCSTAVALDIDDSESYFDESDVFFGEGVHFGESSGHFGESSGVKRYVAVDDFERSAAIDETLVWIGGELSDSFAGSSVSDTG